MSGVVTSDSYIFKVLIDRNLSNDLQEIGMRRDMVVNQPFLSNTSNEKVLWKRRGNSLIERRYVFISTSHQVKTLPVLSLGTLALDSQNDLI
ncbi:hypothetical protein NPIL_669051 [Nephila pilipes]|uniref:Uncharacterized protein n=1 Tax=Nephila pilipes TaxID=299642 RepID=A0A8X6M8W9_NEPPI|nr:hypothetical protein NPIL_669051 [Nephila pilipes]